MLSQERQERQERQTQRDAPASGDSEVARDLAGYGMLQLVVQLPIVLLLCRLFSLSIPFAPPI